MQVVIKLNIQRNIEKQNNTYLMLKPVSTRDEKKASEDIGKYINAHKVVITKSTVPVGTTDKVKNIILKNWSLFVGDATASLQGAAIAIGTFARNLVYNHVKELYDSFTDEQISEKIAKTF